MMRWSFLSLFLATSAHAAVIVGPLQAQNNLSEIAAAGAAAQASARANIGLSSSNTYLPLSGGTLTGALVASGSGSGLAVTNNATVGGTLGVTGVTTLSGDASLTGAGTGLAVTNNATVGGTLKSTGTSTLLSGTGRDLTISDGTTYANMAVANNNPLLFRSNFEFADTTPPANNTEVTLLGATGNTINLSGTQFWKGLNATSANAGATTADQSWYNFGATDNIDTTGAPNGAFTLSVNTNVRGGGTHTSFKAAPSVTAAVTNLGTIVAGSFWTQASANGGGSGAGLLAKGQLFGINPQCVLNSGATFYGSCVGGEFDINAAAGSSVNSNVGLTVVLEAGHAVHGSNNQDTGFSLGAQVGISTGFDYGFAVGGAVGPWPLVSSGTILRANNQTACGGLAQSCKEPQALATYGADFTGVNFSQQSGYSLRMPAMAVDGLGQGTFGGGLVLGTTGTGYKIDVPNAQVVTSVAVSNPGNAVSYLGSYFPGDLVYGTGTPSPGQYKITDTKVIAAVVAAGGSGGTNGTQTVTGTTGTGTKFQVSVTVSGGTITAVLSITVAGDYTVNPAVLSAEPVTGAGLTGATLNIGMGALTVTTLVPDVFASCPGSIATTYGSGAGLTLTPTCAARNTLSIQPTGGATLVSGAVQVGTPTGGMPPAGTINAQGLQVNGVAVAAPLTATSASIGGSALVAGACSTTATTVTGAAVGMVVVSTPNTYPGAGNLWSSYISAANTVTTEICAIVAATPTASTYNLRVIP